MTDLDLDGAYALNSADDARKLYADWAETYDSTFAVEMDFAVPDILAKLYAATSAKGAILDFGAGTGLLGEALARLGVGPIDGADLSEEMLEVARRKNVYRDLVSGDVLDGYQIDGAPYDGVVSSGTFTHGHVGPEAIGILLDLAKPGAQFALSINAEHFHAAGFAAGIEALSGRIIDLSLPEIQFYGENATGPHKDDTGFVAMFRKA